MLLNEQKANPNDQPTKEKDNNHNGNETKMENVIKTEIKKGGNENTKYKLDVFIKFIYFYLDEFGL